MLPYKTVDMRNVRKCPRCFSWVEHGDAHKHERWHDEVDGIRTYIHGALNPELPIDPNDKPPSF